MLEENVDLYRWVIAKKSFAVKVDTEIEKVEYRFPGKAANFMDQYLWCSHKHNIMEGMIDIAGYYKINVPPQEI